MVTLFMRLNMKLFNGIVIFGLKRFCLNCKKFFFNCFLPELVDLRLQRNMPLCSINIDGQAVSKTPGHKKNITRPRQKKTADVFLRFKDGMDMLDDEVDVLKLDLSI